MITCGVEDMAAFIGNDIDIVNEMSLKHDSLTTFFITSHLSR